MSFSGLFFKSSSARWPLARMDFLVYQYRSADGDVLSGQRGSTLEKFTFGKDGETEEMGLPVSQGFEEFSKECK